MMTSVLQATSAFRTTSNNPHWCWRSYCQSTHPYECGRLIPDIVYQMWLEFLATQTEQVANKRICKKWNYQMLHMVAIQHDWNPPQPTAPSTPGGANTTTVLFAKCSWSNPPAVEELVPLYGETNNTIVTRPKYVIYPAPLPSFNPHHTRGRPLRLPSSLFEIASVQRTSIRRRRQVFTKACSFWVTVGSLSMFYSL